jgi:hypothetical protein
MWYAMMPSCLLTFIKNVKSHVVDLGVV